MNELFFYDNLFLDPHTPPTRQVYLFYSVQEYIFSCSHTCQFEIDAQRDTPYFTRPHEFLQKKREREREKPPQHTRISIVPLLARFSSPGHISYSWIRAPPRAFLPPRGGARWTICLESPRATVFLMYRSVGVAKFSRVYGLGG